MTKPLPPIWVRPNGKSGVIMALREANLWHQRESAFLTRQATAAAAYARRQQRWWLHEARLSAMGPRGPLGSYPEHLGRLSTSASPGM